MTNTTRLTSALILSTLLAVGCGGHSDSSKSSSTTGGSTTGGSTPTVTPEVRVSTGPAGGGIQKAAAPAAGLAVGQVRVEANTDATLTSVVLTADGSVDETAGLGDVVLYEDVNGDGLLGAGDVQLGAGGAVASNNGQVTFGGLSRALSAGVPVDLLVTVEVNSAARVGDTVSFRAEGWRFSATDAGGAAIDVDGGGVTGVLYVIGTDPAKTVNATPATNNPGGALAVAAGTADVPVFAVSLATTTGDVDVKGLSLALRGTLDDRADILSARIARDANGDGRIDAGDTVLATSRPDGDDGRLTFNFWGQRLYSGGGYDLVVEVTLAPTAAAGATLTVSMDAGGVLGFNYYGNGGVDVTATPATLVGASLTVSAAAPGLTLASRGPAAGVATGGVEAQAAAFELGAGSAAVDVSAVRVNAKGSVNDATDVAAVNLYADADGDGALSAGDTLLAGPATFAADDGATTLALTTPLSVAAGAQETLFVAATLNAGVSAGQSFQVVIEPANDVRATAAASGDAVHGLLVTGLGSGAVAQPGPALGKDAYLRGEGLYLNDNFGQLALVVGDRYSGQLGERISYVEFPLPRLPQGATPTKAYMAVYLASTNGMAGSTLSFGAYQVIDSGDRTPWIEGRGGLDASADGICYDGVSQATNRPDLTHPDAAPTALDTVTINSGTAGRWVLIDVTAAAQAWYAGSAPNFGVRLRDLDFATHDDGSVAFYSSETHFAGLRPLLLVQH
jgi:hypothetical protein